MSYKSLIVSVTSAETDARALAQAAALAVRHDAHLTGLFVYEPAYYRYPLAYPQIMDIDAEAARGEDEATRAVRDAFHAACRSEGVEKHEWRFVRGEMLATLALHARYADAVVLPQGELAARLAITAPRPVIAVPDAALSGAAGRRVLLAWNATREATRAATAALPVMVLADQVSVLAVDAQGGLWREHGEEPGVDIALYLARHGVEARVCQVDSDPEGIAGTLITEALEMDADLLCMGAYGHSRLRELVLGGVTQDLLAGPLPLPVLLAH